MTKTTDQFIKTAIKKVGLLCGAGQLPLKVMGACNDRHIPFFAIAFPGQTPESAVERCDHKWVHLGAIGDILTALKQKNVSHIVFAGGIRRPSWSELGLDWKGTMWLARMGLKSLGDDGILSAATQLLESEGFEVLSPSYFIDYLRCPVGCLTNTKPTHEDEKDIERGLSILSLLSAADVGQGVIVQQGLVLAIEAIEGTAQMIMRAGELKRAGSGGVLVKVMKLNQNQKVDLPTIGPQTIHELVKAGLKGVAVGALTTQVIDLSETVKLANQAGLFLVGIPQ